MSGVRPIEMNIQAALCEQAPSFILHNYFYMNFRNSSALPIHKLPYYTNRLQYIFSPATYFMSGVRPIEMNIQAVLCEQAPTFILHIHFCTAELLSTVYHNFSTSSIIQNRSGWQRISSADISLQSDDR